MDINQRVSIIKSSLKKIKEIAIETKNLENDWLSSKSVNFIDDLWINTLNEAFKWIQKYFKDTNSLKEVNKIITDLVKYKLENKEELFSQPYIDLHFLWNQSKRIVNTILKNFPHYFLQYLTLLLKIGLKFEI